MSSISREIITLQVGHYSNFIGSHWWNIQENSFVFDKNSNTDIEHDYLFQEGRVSGNQVTYTPRLLIIDGKGALGSLPSIGHLYESCPTTPSTSEALWSGPVDLIKQLPEEKNEFLKYLDKEDSKYQEFLNEDESMEIHENIPKSEVDKISQNDFNLAYDVKVWSDFLRTHIHPRTVYLLQNVWHNNVEEGSGYWPFQEGVSVSKKEETKDEISDRIRLLAESCESLQGFHLLCDGHNGMGGVGWTMAQHLEDDYGSKDLFSFISTPPHYKPTTAQDLTLLITSVVQCYTELSKLSSFVLPLNLKSQFWNSNSDAAIFPHLLYKVDNAYETSSVLSAFMDTITMPYRTKHDPLPMSHFGDMVTPLQRKVVNGSVALPLGLTENSFLADWLMENNDFEYQSVSGCLDFSSNPVTEHKVIRGIYKNRLISSDIKLPTKTRYNTAWQLYDDFLKERDSHIVRRNVFGIEDRLKTSLPFPRIFEQSINESGFLRAPSNNPHAPSIVTSTPMAASIVQSEGVAKYLREVLIQAQNINVAKFPRLMDEVDRESWNNAKDDLSTLLENYNSGENMAVD